MKINRFALALIIAIILTTMVLPYSIMASTGDPGYGYGGGGNTPSNFKKESKDFFWVAGGAGCEADFASGGGATKGTMNVEGDCIGLGQISLYVGDSCENPVVTHNGEEWFPVFYSNGRVYTYAYSGALDGSWSVSCK